MQNVEHYSNVNSKFIDDPQKLGYFAGLIASSYYLSQLFSSFFWGYLSDIVGRRPILLIGVTLGSLSCCLFGFSKWLWWAILSRFLFGLLNGNLGVTKSYLTEITGKYSFQAKKVVARKLLFGSSNYVVAYSAFFDENNV